MLPIAKYPKFLSPSSLAQYEKMPITFYLTRMAPEPLKIVSDTRATSLGTAIDAEIKLHICNQFGWTEKIKLRVLNDIFDPLQRERSESLSLERLLFENIPSTDMETMALGRAIGRLYCKSPMYASLDIVDVEYHPRFNIYNNSMGVNIYCKLDITIQIPYTVLNNGVSSTIKCMIPLDIKSTSGSPAQGYMMLYDPSSAPLSVSFAELQSKCKKHNIYHNGITMNDISEQWDTQLLTYHMALKYMQTNKPININTVPTSLPAMIEQICIGSSVRVARFMATCGSPAMLYERYSSMWNAIYSGAFTDGLLNNRMLLEYFAQQERFY
jgi:hypothetical protein